MRSRALTVVARLSPRVSWRRLRSRSSALGALDRFRDPFRAAVLRLMLFGCGRDDAQLAAP
jgi:hypothetical protein